MRTSIISMGSLALVVVLASGCSSDALPTAPTAATSALTTRNTGTTVTSEGRNGAPRASLTSTRTQSARSGYVIASGRNRN